MNKKDFRTYRVEGGKTAPSKSNDSLLKIFCIIFILDLMYCSDEPFTLFAMKSDYKIYSISGYLKHVLKSDCERGSDHMLLY